MLTLTAETSIAPPPHIGKRRAKFASGYNRIGGQILPLLNIDAVFDFTDDQELTGAGPQTVTPIQWS